MQKRLSFVVVVSAVIAVVILLHVSTALRPVENGIQVALLPIGRFFGGIGSGISDRGSSGRSAAELEADVRDLQAQLATKSVDYVKLKSLEEENQSLRDVAKFLSSSGYDHVGANVIARSNMPQSQTVLIDRGAKDGIEIGMAAVVGDGVLVGKVLSVGDHVATILLASDPRSRLAASPLGAHKLFGVVEGEGNGVARLTLVPQSEPLSRDDIIVTAGTEEKIPANLPIATVEETEGKPTDPFKTATLQPLVKTDRLGFVIILRPVALRPEGGK